ncbi:hypothetical protein [Thermoanaerobacter kivui]|nr:hypothetical protein [Thermoanaerobacter kivui]
MKIVIIDFKTVFTTSRPVKEKPALYLTNASLQAREAPSLYIIYKLSFY